MADRIAGVCRLAATAVLLVISAACAHGTRMSSGDAPAQPRENRTVWVVEGSEMTAGFTVLEGLRSRFPAVQVRSSQRCPELVIRGRSSIQGSSAPLVYVDGQRAADACILSLIRAAEVNRVEVYPTGQTSRPGYFSNGTGLVLVFTLDGVVET
jgi:hypothetical protein